MVAKTRLTVLLLAPTYKTIMLERKIKIEKIKTYCINAAYLLHSVIILHPDSRLTETPHPKRVQLVVFSKAKSVHCDLEVC